MRVRGSAGRALECRGAPAPAAAVHAPIAATATPASSQRCGISTMSPWIRASSATDGPSDEKSAAKRDARPRKRSRWRHNAYIDVTELLRVHRFPLQAQSSQPRGSGARLSGAENAETSRIGDGIVCNRIELTCLERRRPQAAPIRCRTAASKRFRIYCAREAATVRSIDKKSSPMSLLAPLPPCERTGGWR